MQAIIFFSLLLIRMQHIQSDKNFDHFVMSEAYITEYRANEDANAGYAPFYMQCPEKKTRNSCFPAIPELNEGVGYITMGRDYYENTIYYGCLKEQRPSNEFNPKHYKKTLTMKLANAASHSPNSHFEIYYNVYEQKCVSEISPAIWKVGSETRMTTSISYQIGFMIDGHNDMPLAEVYFDHAKKIPLRTKHTLYGKSLAAPTAAFRTVEELVYEEDSENFTVEDLHDTIQQYYKFNMENGNTSTKELVNVALTAKNLDKIPRKSKISMAHLIPEYDMIEISWKKVANFAHTIVPMWTDLYVNEWADVENKIRQVAFMNGKHLTVFSGTHGQLTFNYEIFNKNDNRNKFFLRSVSVPETIWKLVIDEKVNVRKKKQAIVIILRNLSKELASLNIFTQFQPPCESKCMEFMWDGIEKPNVLYCCQVHEVRNIIDELPDVAKNENFDLLLNNAE